MPNATVPEADFREAMNSLEDPVGAELGFIIKPVVVIEDNVCPFVKMFAMSRYNAERVTLLDMFPPVTSTQ